MKGLSNRILTSSFKFLSFSRIVIIMKRFHLLLISLLILGVMIFFVQILRIGKTPSYVFQIFNIQLSLLIVIVALLVFQAMREARREVEEALDICGIIHYKIGKAYRKARTEKGFIRKALDVASAVVPYLESLCEHQDFIRRYPELEDRCQKVIRTFGHYGGSLGKARGRRDIEAKVGKELREIYQMAEGILRNYGRL